MSAARTLPELLPVERFLRLLSHLGLVSAIVGDHFAVLIVDVDDMEFVARRHGHAAERTCRGELVERLRATMPVDGLLTQLDENAFGILAFGADSEPAALRLANEIHAAVRAPIETQLAEVRMSASIGVAFASPSLRPVQALERADQAVIRVKLNGGDATWVDAAAPQPSSPAPLSSLHPALAPMPEPAFSS